MNIGLFKTCNVLLHSLCLTATISMNLTKPRQIARVSETYALDKGWGINIILLTRITQYYTILSQLLLIVSLLCDKKELVVLAHIYQTCLFLLYYGIVYFDVGHITYVENFPNVEYIKRVVAFTPPIYSKDKTEMIAWATLNTQHLLAPLYFWVEGYLFKSIKHDNSLIMEVNIIFILYGLWNFFCWHVQGVPAYPIQKKVYDKSIVSAIMFYASCLGILNVSAMLCNYYF